MYFFSMQILSDPEIVLVLDITNIDFLTWDPLKEISGLY